jgi:threonine dehydrogenase-like Zn-dependent dehydrogenase
MVQLSAFEMNLSFGQVVHPADLCFKLPDNVSLEEGAMCEPLSVGVHACRRANIGPETNVLVMGAGPIGLVTLLAARAFGAPRIVIVDVDDHRLSVAKELGADGIIKVSTNIQVSAFYFTSRQCIVLLEILSSFGSLFFLQYKIL